MRTLGLASCILLAGFVPHACGQTGSGVLLRIDNDQVQVEQVRLPLSRKLAESTGLLVWSEGGLDRWASLPLKQSPTKSRSRRSSRRRSTSRTRGESSQATQAVAMLTVQLDQLIGGEVLRAVEDGGLVTPSDDVVHLNPKLTFRRLESGGDLRADEFLLSGDDGELLKIPFAESQAVLGWSEIPDLPDALKDGLPTGEYRIQSQDRRFDISFYVEEAPVRRALLDPIERLAELVGREQDPLVLQFALEQLIDPTSIGTEGEEESESYIVDAYDRVTDVPLEELTPFLARVRVALHDRLTGGRTQPPQSPAETTPAVDTGIADIDLARRRISGGRWDDAMQLLTGPKLRETPRGEALSLLYQAVILAESAQATGDAAEETFIEAINRLKDGEAADQFRAHNNFGNFLLRRAQDRLYNHSFRIASGVANPMLGGLVDWCHALEEYQTAQQLSESLGAAQQAGVAANLARLYSLLADFIRVLNSTIESEKRFAAGESAASGTAALQAEEAFQAAGDDTAVRAVALELLAHLAHRQRETSKATEHAKQALGAYLDEGALAGAESIHRLLGLVALRADVGSETSPESRGDALRHFQIADLLAQSLRDRFPADSIGLTRAGFLARRAYVNEQIVQLLVAEGDHAAALRFLETAKARSLQDVLLSGAESAIPVVPQTTPTADLLANWPADVTALEYFLGTDEPLVFFVDRTGEVSAHPLQDETGKPLTSAELVARVQQFLSKTEATASKLLRMANSGRGFDASWQTELNTFYGHLVPEAVREEIAEAGRVLVVPHHILHYFPFAALVTEPDTSQHSNYEMPMPKFWIEQPVDLWYAPSLAIWRLMREKSSTPSKVVNAVGIVEFSQAQPLPGVERDLAHLREAFPDRLRKVVDRANATEANVRAVLDEPGMLFVATHGMNLADHPLSSYLLCHSGESEDGRLTAGEIFGRNVSSQIVVLSACYSGLADRSPLPGDDLFGLERALLQSGASTVVAGLWDVYDDAGAEIMHEFFKQMASGNPTAESLLNAQRQFIAQRRQEGPSDPWIHPYFWAVYKSSGSDATRLGQ